MPQRSIERCMSENLDTLQPPEGESLYRASSGRQCGGPSFLGTERRLLAEVVSVVSM